MGNEKNSNQELDLDLINQYGFLNNNEVKLADKKFLTNEKLAIVGEIVSELFEKNDPNLSELAK
jgi:hypothetical protein